VGSAIDTDGDELSDADELAYGTAADNPDSDGDGVRDGAEVLRYQTSPTSAVSVPTLTAAVITEVAPATTCTVARFAAAASDHPGPYAYEWSAGGVTSSQAVLETRLRTAGPRTVQVTVRNPDNVRGTASVNVTVGAASQDVRLVVKLRAADPDRLDFIRRVELNATGLGFSRPVRLFDDGVTGGDEDSGDGIFSNTLFVSGCESLSTPITASVMDAAGMVAQLALTPSEFVAP